MFPLDQITDVRAGPNKIIIFEAFQSMWSVP